MYRRTVALVMALVSSPMLAADARADLLLAVDGVELHGTAQLLRPGATTCNVLESDTSGYLDGASVPALAESGGGAAGSTGLPGGIDARPRAAALFRPARTCAGERPGVACWMEVSERPGCYVQNERNGTSWRVETVTWTGECSRGLAQGTGSLAWVRGEREEVSTGRLQDGERNGDWIHRHANGNVEEGPYVDGKRNGHWALRYASGQVHQGPYDNGVQTGHWILRFPSGTVEEGPYVNGGRNGHWVIRGASGTVSEGPLVGGKRNGNWGIRYANGSVHEGPYVNGERNGNWVERSARGEIGEGPYVNGERNGNWVVRFPGGTVWEGPYVDDEWNGNWVFRYPDGAVHEGRFVDGRFVDARPTSGNGRPVETETRGRTEPRRPREGRPSAGGGFCGLAIDAPTYIVMVTNVRGYQCNPSLKGARVNFSGGCNKDFLGPSDEADSVRGYRSPDGGAPYCTMTHRDRTIRVYRVATHIDEPGVGRVVLGGEAQRSLAERFGVPFDIDFRR